MNDKFSTKRRIRRHIRAAVGSLGLLASVCMPAHAQDGASGNTTIALPELVVSPTGTPTPIDQVGNSVTVVTADQIANQQRRTVNEVLSAVPGLNIVQTGGPGGQTYVFMRGTNSNHVKILIDGVDASDPSTSKASFDFGQLLTGDIERIEILRGPQSGLYGADAIGGVISIITKKGSGPPKATASVEGGSQGTFNQRAGLSGSNSIVNYSFHIDHYRSTDIAVTPTNLLLPGTRAWPNVYDNYTYSGKAGADLSENIAINAMARYTDSKLLYTNDGACFCAPDPSRSTQNDRQFFTRGEAIWRSLDDRYRTTLGIGYSNQRTRNIFAPEDYTDPATTIGERLKFDLKQEIKLTQSEKLTFGLEHEYYRLDTGDLIASDTNKAAYAQLESSPFENFNVTSNIRYDDYQSFGGHFTYRVAPTYTFSQTGTQLKASYGTGFKAPTLSQLYQDFPAFNFWANPNLRPEESTGFDVGLEQPLFDNRVRIGSTYFQNNIRNLIDTSADFTTSVNVGRAKTYGNESFATLTVNDQLNFRTDYTFTIATDEDTGLQLLRRPRHKASLQANWSPQDKLRLSATLVYVSSWVDVDRDYTVPRLKASPYATVNLAANYDLNDHATLYARVDNLFNRQYQNPVGYLQPGFGVFGGVRVAAF